MARNVFEMTGFMKVIGLVFGRSFPKQNYAYMVAFKEFADRS